MSKTEANQGPKVARMDISAGRLTGKSGDPYFITSDLSAERYSQFLAYQPTITKGASYSEWAAHNNEIHVLATDGNNVLGNLHKIAMKTMNMNNTWKEFTGKRVHAMVWFCMLFINSEDENLGEWDERKVQLKIQDLSHYSIQDFFLLGQNVLNEWRKEFRRSKGFDPAEMVPADLTVGETLTQDNIVFTFPKTTGKE